MVATVIAGEVTRDGATIDERALRGVGGLAQFGIGEADVVAIMLRNELAFLEAMLIARRPAAIPVRSTGTTRRTRPATSCATAAPRR